VRHPTANKLVPVAIVARRCDSLILQRDGGDDRPRKAIGALDSDIPWTAIRALPLGAQFAIDRDQIIGDAMGVEATRQLIDAKRNGSGP